MVGINFKGLSVVYAGFLILMPLVVPNRQIVRCFEVGVCSITFLPIIYGQVCVSLPIMNHCQVIECLYVVGNVGQGKFIGMDGHFYIP